MTAIRVAILTPTAFPIATGNAISAERWRRSLSEIGAVVKVIGIDPIIPRDLIRGLDSFGPHLIHAHHISRAGVLMLDPDVAQQYQSLPLIVSPAGTDINHYLLKEAQGAAVENICGKARFIVAQSAEMSKRLRELFPDLKRRIVYVPKSFSWHGGDRYDLRSAAGCLADDILFFMPAGIRPVKGNIECLLAVEEAHAANDRIRAVFAGPALDPAYTKRFEEELHRLHSIARWIHIPPQAMHSAYAGADMVVNYSASEGLANSLIEAIAAGRPVLASNVPGNLWLTNGESSLSSCACLFDPEDRADFVRKALQVAEPYCRESMAVAARLRASKLPLPSEEAQSLLEIYESALK